MTAQAPRPGLGGLPRSGARGGAGGGAAPEAPARPRPRKRRFSDPGRTWAKRLERYRPGLVPYVLDGLAAALRATRRGSAGSTRPAS